MGCSQHQPTGRERVAAYLAELKDPMQASYQCSVRSKPLSTRLVWGRDRTRPATVTGLPVPANDSIFAVIVRNGSVGGIFDWLYALLIWRGLVIARRAPDMLGTLIASGMVISSHPGSHQYVGDGWIDPFSGDALPFVSAGGSNLIPRWPQLEPRISRVKMGNHRIIG